MRLFRPLAVGLGGLALTLALPAGAALASSGTFTWLGPGGKAYSLQNPPDKRCLDMSQEARGARNALKQPVAVYTGKHCTGQKTQLAPGKVAPSGARFASVVFNPR
ncbi:hypothetical protein ACIQU6_36345 [Streptomyces sp. NPDC090442]|uniref:hypothetical protein n=1 Tax=Streptomyces sp. NPDC090442 TaxID=3365962 RepID=UPI0037FF8BFD